jgi:uncharacterized membrane protein
MVIMALDHVRDFMHIYSMSGDPTNLETTTALLFFTRWVTHLCAPTFVFLSGVSAYISFKRKGNTSESSRFLLSRGIWLVILEFTFINFALWFDIYYRLLLMEVIAAIGLSFIVLSLLLKVHSRIIGAIGIIIIFGHNLLQGLPLPENPLAAFIASVLLRPNLIQLTSATSFFSAYPLIPWLGILLAGFACGEFFEMDEAKRKKLFLKIAVFTLSAFAVLRFLNFYGDPVKWVEQKSTLFTFLSFINVTKYPPSLDFTLLFIGFTFLILYITEKSDNRVSNFFSVYGKVPLFYFIIHLYLIHLLMFAMLFIQGFGINDLVFGLFSNGRPKSGGGVELSVIYLIWLAVVLLLYPVCLWYGNYKNAHKKNPLFRYL